MPSCGKGKRHPRGGQGEQGHHLRAGAILLDYLQRDCFNWRKTQGLAYANLILAVKEYNWVGRNSEDPVIASLIEALRQVVMSRLQSLSIVEKIHVDEGH